MMIQKALLFSAVAALVSGLAQGGQIQVGQIVGSTNLGLTSGTTLNTGGSITTSGVTLLAYNNVMYQGATLTQGGALAPLPSGTVTDPNNAGGATFDLVGVGGNTWYNNSNPASHTDTITIPINISGVDEVWTLLNDMQGSNTDVVFYLNNSDTLTNATQITVDLADNAEIRSAVLCSMGCPATMNTGLNPSNNPNYYVGNSVTPGGTIVVTTGSIQFPSTSSSVWNQSYTGTAGQNGFSSTSSGTLTMDDQGFNLSSLAALYGSTLVEIQVTQASGAPSIDHFDLQAVTVGTVPEPSTTALFALGLGLVGWSVARRAKSSSRGV
jgi:hypothetical protein